MESNFKEMTQFAVKAFNLCNFKVNWLKACKEIRLVFFGNRLGYIDDHGVFYFRVANNNIKLNNTTKTQILDIIAHELSHLNQRVDYDRYNNDIEYMKQIEIENIDNTYNFIINNKDLIEKELKFKLDMNYMEMIKNYFR